MKLDKRREDFSKNHANKLRMTGGCCCCCAFWIGSLVGGVLGTLLSDQYLEQYQQEDEFKTSLRQIRKVYWLTVGLSVVAGFLIMGLDATDSSLVTTLASIPAVNVFLAGWIASTQVDRRVTVHSYRRALYKRIWFVTGGVLIGYGLGWLALHLID